MTTTLNRRRLLALASVGVGLAHAGDGFAQERAATPIATPVPVATPETTQTPAQGGNLRLVRPGESLDNLNPAAFAVDY